MPGNGRTKDYRPAITQSLLPNRTVWGTVHDRLNEETGGGKLPRLGIRTLNACPWKSNFKERSDLEVDVNIRKLTLVPLGAALALTTLTAAIAAKPPKPTHIVDKLDGPAIGDVAPRGRSIYHATLQNQRFQVHVHKVELADATLDVFVDGVDVGDIILDDGGSGHLLLRTRHGDAVPTVGDSSTVEVKNQADGTVILDNIP